MLYNETTIQSLIDRIGWFEAIQPSAITLDPSNSESESGRFFNSFHQLCTIENVNSCIPNPGADNTALNDFLYKMKRDSVLEVLSGVFDNNPLAYRATQEIDGKTVTSLGYRAEYNDVVAQKISIFDNAIGYSMAVRCLQLFLTTNRSNRDKKVIDLSYDQMKLELEGFFNEYGKLIAQGSFQKYQHAVDLIIEILFPTKTTTNKRIIGRNVW